MNCEKKRRLKSSLDWAEVQQSLTSDMASMFKDNMPQAIKSDFLRVCKNVDAMVAELSRAELKARTTFGHSKRTVNEHLKKINDEIFNIEQLVMLARLSLK